MGLYLCVFEDDVSDREIDGVEVGMYDDFHVFRVAVAELVPGAWGSSFPILMLHTDCDGEWPVGELSGLREELIEIRGTFARQPARNYEAGWQRDVAAVVGHRPSSMADFFIDVDGEPLLDRLVSLVGTAILHKRPVTFA